VLSLPPPELPADNAYSEEEALPAACGLKPPSADDAVAYGNEDADTADCGGEAGGPDGDEDAPEASVPAEVGTQEPKRRQAFKALEIAAQIHQVQEWLTLGKRPNEIRRLCDEHWGLSTRVAETRMADARRQMILDVNSYDRKEMCAKMLQSLESVLNQALEMRQGSNAIGAMRLQADLLQLLSRQN
jgi:hypothetical protein